MPGLYATGRRKDAIAKVWVKSGSGKITVNKKDVKEFFERDTHVIHLKAPLEVTTSTGKYDISCTVLGGGKTGQAGAIRMGIARCLSKTDENVHSVLSKGGYLTRDSRMVERKKYGKAKARKSYQFSKR
ncbi:MAG TPA: 30S ribosomal protein S9 [Firmicutes bacterium]|nr:30S ribosomal protein S9 [Bacillota bacterium]